MPASDQISLLRRKMGGGPAQGAQSDAASSQLAVLRAAARAAFSTAGLRVDMQNAEQRVLAGVSAVIASVSEAMLIVPFAAPDGAEGFVALSQEFAQSLIEKATTGHLSKLPMEPRRASSIDLLLCRDFLSRFFDTWKEIAAGTEDAKWLEGYAPGDRATDVDLMLLNAREVPYRQFTVALRFDEHRDATMSATFPAERHPRREVAVDTPQNADARWGEIWRNAVLDSHAELDAVMARVSVPLKTVQGWTIGDRLDVPHAALSRVALGRPGGSVVATARLGQANGYRALRLNGTATADGASGRQSVLAAGQMDPASLPRRDPPMDTGGADTPGPMTGSKGPAIARADPMPASSALDRPDDHAALADQDAPAGGPIADPDTTAGQDRP